SLLPLPRCAVSGGAEPTRENFCFSGLNARPSDALATCLACASLKTSSNSTLSPKLKSKPASAKGWEDPRDRLPGNCFYRPWLRESGKLHISIVLLQVCFPDLNFDNCD